MIFVIDTSGSMQRFAWPLLLRKMSQILDAYPKVKGLQVMNDEGVYMFSSYAGKWIPDTAGRRQAVLQRLATWNVFSNSSPVEGIEAAIKQHAKGNLKISIYVLGDEFTGRSVEGVLRAVDYMNSRDASGAKRVRIHGIGFPTLFSQAGQGGVPGDDHRPLRHAHARALRAQRGRLRRAQQPGALRDRRAARGRRIANATSASPSGSSEIFGWPPAAMTTNCLPPGVS